ncbi:MAG TPA: hypothetical protein DHU75_00580 [Rikenellaceae bacterium]|nr:hypothetical protein [Rikenellaceae bacterium]
MKRLFCFITTFLIFAVSIKAQKAASVSLDWGSEFMNSVIERNSETEVASKSNTKDAFIAYRVLTDVGKSITYIGGGMAYAGAAYLLMLSYDHRIDPVYGLAAIVGIAGFAYGGIAALCGMSVWTPGEIVLRSNGKVPVNYAHEDKRGLGVLLDISTGYTDSVCPKIAVGYNFNKHLFMGIGTSYNIYFKRTENTKDILPVYIKTEITIGSHAVAPYIDVDLGVDALDGSFYYSTGMGARYRLSSHQNSLSVGTFVEACNKLQTIGIRLSYSF